VVVLSDIDCLHRQAIKAQNGEKHINCSSDTKKANNKERSEAENMRNEGSFKGFLVKVAQWKLVGAMKRIVRCRTRAQDRIRADNLGLRCVSAPSVPVQGRRSDSTTAN
jgi:hypothetical protein